MSELAAALARARRRSESAEELAASIAAANLNEEEAESPAAASAATASAAVGSKTPEKSTASVPAAVAASNSSSSKVGGTTSGSATDYTARFEALTSLSVEDQANAFLTQFVMEFRGNFDEVLNIALEFKGFAGAKKQGMVVQELDEFQAHQFLERRGETLTVREMRNALREIDIDSNGKVALIEYLLFKYNKTLEDMFSDNGDAVPQELLDALNAAMEAFRKVAQEKEKRQRKMDKLRAKAAKGGVLGKAAQHELEGMLRQDETERNRREITAAAATRKAKRNIAKADKSALKKKAVAEEKKRQEEAARKRAAEEKKKRMESRARLKAKAALWEK